MIRVPHFLGKLSLQTRTNLPNELKRTLGCVCLFVLHPLLFPYRGSGTRFLSSASKTDQANFTDWMS